MKNSFLKLAGAIALVFSLGVAANATPIVGAIQIDAFASTASVNFTTHTITFNGTIPNQNGLVTNALGDYAALLGAGANYTNFQYQPFAPQTIWTITLTPTTYFVLTAITLINETGNVGVSLWGNGMAYMAGKDATAGSWTFSSSRNPQDSTFNFSSSTTTIPDGGMTALLLGLGLISISAVSFKKKK